MSGKIAEISRLFARAFPLGVAQASCRCKCGHVLIPMRRMARLIPEKGSSWCPEIELYCLDAQYLEKFGVKVLSQVELIEFYRLGARK